MIVIKTERELEIMRQAGRIVALTHAHLKPYIKPGVTTGELDSIAEAFIRSHDATPSFLGYGGFKGSVCASVNEELVHGIPGNRVLEDGDIISLDIGAYYNGYHGDSAWTYGVGTIKEEDQQLLDATEESLYKGLEQARPGNRLSDISHAIQSHVEPLGYSVVREYVGHGVGQNLHEDPQIPHYGPPGKGPRLKPGMVLAIEPMINAGSRYVKTLSDNWTVVTVDKKNCAHFEHTIAITETGYEILTKA
ncbi:MULTISPECIES: type I methionyl aminopeptidase [Shouchella]|uniref:Methionine aminopeptidase n=5 Tax=Bacillaceae TaxID=186817 RepID=A0A060LMU1_9BACI|nr:MULTISPECIES: type I methionyl aminopeptidase [Bacillaceae]RQW23610.1 type I methionyl aminopeptidase [Bacillus sp. C1-1]AIC92676.1 methionine aminopeptidase [Shouchella lehensis G1]KQL56881.1 methionine aminopeptidase [Alkalicoccobacillus plakortidis]MBG9782452.1 methionine aminopeptidase [Shouchella lehensis]MED4128918.1 type I methionyl aminopeptidase [Shouchella miscanthi]